MAVSRNFLEVREISGLMESIKDLFLTTNEGVEIEE